MENQTWYIITRLDVCPHCEGTTWVADPAAPHRLTRCQHCNQHGIVTRTRAATDDDVQSALHTIQQKE
jgi:DnaJ-class molecular chaperone